MLQNPQWDFHSLVGLRDWLAKQPADGEYIWTVREECVVGKYLMAHGESWSLYSRWINQTPGGDAAVTECFSDYVPGGGRQRTTFGMALERLDAWIASH